jgi:hypothetical protein
MDVIDLTDDHLLDHHEEECLQRPIGVDYSVDVVDLLNDDDDDGVDESSSCWDTRGGGGGRRALPLHMYGSYPGSAQTSSGTYPPPPPPQSLKGQLECESAAQTPRFAKELKENNAHVHSVPSKEVIDICSSDESSAVGTDMPIVHHRRPANMGPLSSTTTIRRTSAISEGTPKPSNSSSNRKHRDH